jgi:hypothetical protein
MKIEEIKKIRKKLKITQFELAIKDCETLAFFANSNCVMFNFFLIFFISSIFIYF